MSPEDEEVLCKKARQLGCDGNQKIAKYVLGLEKRLDDMEEEIKTLKKMVKEKKSDA
jgi:hypothetical protein